jgi:hypothetical protein
LPKIVVDPFDGIVIAVRLRPALSMAKFALYQPALELKPRDAVFSDTIFSWEYGHG